MSLQDENGNIAEALGLKDFKEMVTEAVAVSRPKTDYLGKNWPETYRHYGVFVTTDFRMSYLIENIPHEGVVISDAQFMDWDVWRIDSLIKIKEGGISFEETHGIEPGLDHEYLTAGFCIGTAQQVAARIKGEEVPYFNIKSIQGFAPWFVFSTFYDLAVQTYRKYKRKE